MNLSREETLTNEIFEVVQGWQTSTIGWQSSSDALVSEANYKKAREDHNNECKRRIAKVLQSRLAEGEQELPTGECFKSYGALCARCGHDEFVLPAAPQGAPK